MAVFTQATKHIFLYKILPLPPYNQLFLTEYIPLIHNNVHVFFFLILLHHKGNTFILNLFYLKLCVNVAYDERRKRKKIGHKDKMEYCKR